MVGWALDSFHPNCSVGGRRNKRKLGRLDIGGHSDGCQAPSLINVLRLSRCCAGQAAKVGGRSPDPKYQDETLKAGL